MSSSMKSGLVNEPSDARYTSKPVVVTLAGRQTGSLSTWAMDLSVFTVAIYLIGSMWNLAHAAS